MIKPAFKLLLVLLVNIAFMGFFAGFNKAYAICVLCSGADCVKARMMIKDAHERGKTMIFALSGRNFNGLLNTFPTDPHINLRDQFQNHRTWTVNTYIKEHIIPALQDMTAQLHANGLYQIATVGKFFDAKNQLEAERLFGELKTEAYRDYQPTESFCAIGTNVDHLFASEAKAKENTKGLKDIALKRHLGYQDIFGEGDQAQDKLMRWENFKKFYCNPEENGDKKQKFCEDVSLGNADRYNRDVNYTRLIEAPRTIEADFSNEQLDGDIKQDIFALANNLYAHDILPLVDEEDNSISNREIEDYLDYRSIAARRAVAEGSFHSIVGLKSAGAGDAKYLGAVLKDLGLNEKDIKELLGDQPSYYAQLEVLSKKLFQSPNFFKKLSGRPADAKRKKAALNAIELIVDRAIFESELRQEMILSVLLSTSLENEIEDAGIN